MEVVRTNIYDFVVVLTETEFRLVKIIADCDNISIEQAFTNAIETGLFTKKKTLTGKGQANVVER